MRTSTLKNKILLLVVALCHLVGCGHKTETDVQSGDRVRKIINGDAVDMVTQGDLAVGILMDQPYTTSCSVVIHSPYMAYTTEHCSNLDWISLEPRVKRGSSACLEPNHRCIKVQEKSVSQIRSKFPGFIAEGVVFLKLDPVQAVNAGVSPYPSFSLPPSLVGWKNDMTDYPYFSDPHLHVVGYGLNSTTDTSNVAVRRSGTVLFHGLTPLFSDLNSHETFVPWLDLREGEYSQLPYKGDSGGPVFQLNPHLSLAGIIAQSRDPFVNGVVLEPAEVHAHDMREYAPFLISKHNFYKYGGSPVEVKVIAIGAKNVKISGGGVNFGADAHGTFRAYVPYNNPSVLRASASLSTGSTGSLKFNWRCEFDRSLAEETNHIADTVRSSKSTIEVETSGRLIQCALTISTGP